MHSGNPGKYLLFISATLLLAVGSASAAINITDVVNAGNRIGSGLPGYGIAQGSLFAVTGQGVGPDQPVQATFPLTSDAGLGGVTISVNVAGSTAFALMVYVSPNEVDAILPSSTPAGAGTVTVNNNGATATAPLTVVAAAFGIFTTTGSGFGGALAFNVNPDGSTTQNSALQAAQPGQTVMINGTGLGAIQSDETQAGDTDVPSAGITVWVGNTQAAVTSAGRGTCCDGLSPTFPFPSGIAAWDVISIVVPDGVSGCQVSVAVQIGNLVSNLAAIAVGPGGGSCPEIAALNLGDFVTLPDPYKQGLITMTRVVTSVASGPTTSVVTSDSASAQFFSVDLGMPVQVSDIIYAAYLKATAGSCSVQLYRLVTTPPPSSNPPPNGNKPVPLDAGPVINVVDPDRTQAMPNKNNFYSAGTVITSLTLPGSPPITTGGPGFFASSWSMNNGAGGADIGGFNVAMTSPLPITVTGFDQLNSIVRGQDLPLAWTGGDPNGYMTIGGSAVRAPVNGVSYSGLWYCTVRVGDGQFVVPGFVTAGLPQLTQATGPAGAGVINFTPIIIQFVNVPGVDLTNYISTWSIGKGVTYQ